MELKTSAVTDITLPPEMNADPIVTTKEVVVMDGVADVPPSIVDYYELMYGRDVLGDTWLALPFAVENANELIGHMDEVAPPDLRVRWTLHQSLMKIREAADVLEKHIAKRGLWLSQDEVWKCQSEDMGPLYHGDFRKEKEEFLDRIPAPTET